MSNDPANIEMHVPKQSKPTRHTPSFSTKTGEMARQLSYSNMVMNQNGTLLRQDEIQEMRLNQGFCPTCKGTPVKLFEVRKTKLNPLWKSKEPLTAPNVSYKGLCLVCHPNTSVEQQDSSSGQQLHHRSSMLSNVSAKTQETSSRSAFVGGNLTVTRFDDSQQQMGSLLDQTEASFHTAADHCISDSMISTLTQEQGMESFVSAQEFSSSLVGKPLDVNGDSLKKGSSAQAAAKHVEPADLYHHRKSPPLVLSGIPTDARSNDSLDVSRRNSVPVPSGPELSSNGAAAQKAPAPKKVSPPTMSTDDAAEQQEILKALSNRRGSAPKYKPHNKHAKPAPGGQKAVTKPKKRASGRQAAETMDRLRAAYERTFCSTSIQDDISAITIDIEHSNSSTLEHNNSGGVSYDSDSLLEEFSVPDFSMGTDAIKSHRQPKPTKAKNKVQAPAPRPSQKLKAAVVQDRGMTDIPRKPYVPSKKAAAIETQPTTDIPRTPYVPPKSYEDFAIKPPFEGDDECKPKADMVHKPKPRPATSVPKKKDAGTTLRMYQVMDSGVSAIPGPPEKLSSLSRVEQRSLDPPAVANPPNVFAKYGYQANQYEYPPNELEGFPRNDASCEDGSTLAPPSLVDSSVTVGELTVETKTSGDAVSLDSKVEEVAGLINDVVAAENSEFLAELLSNTMRTHRERVDIQSLCLRTIWDMSKYNFENKGVIMATGLYDCVISAMKDFPNSVEVQSSGCGALWSLSVNQFNRVILVRAGACERILRGLDTHLNNEDFVQTAFGALRTLSPEPEARMVINHMLGSQRVVRAMGLHRFVVDIQRDGCAFLSNVAVDMDNQEVSVVSREELQAVVRAMRDHLKNESVVTSACFTLKNFSYEERNVRNLRLFDDVVVLLEDAAQYATKASCRRDAAEVLERIQLLQTEDAALEETAFSSLMQAMRRTSTEKNPAKQVEESVATITEVIKEYYWSIRLICFGLESLLSLADKSEAHLSRILSPKTLRVVVNTMKEHASNPKVQQRGCELLRSLAEPNKPVNRMEICMEEGCCVIVSALRNHRGDESVEIPAYTALKALAQEPMCAEEIQRSGGWQILREHEHEVPIPAETEASGDAAAADAKGESGEAVDLPEQQESAKRPSAS